MLDRFVLLAYPRTGSSLVGHALQAHPAVVMYGELFHPFLDFRKSVITAPQEAPYPLADYYRDGADPVAYLEKVLYGRDFPAEKKTVGFKLFHQHLRGDSQTRLFGWLAETRDIRLIHLYRKRLLEEYVSIEVAKATKQWGIEMAADANAVEAPLLTIDVEQFKHYADEILGYREQVPGMFRDHRMMTIEYHEDIVNHFDSTVQHMEDFLGIDGMPLPQTLKKQAQRPVEETVTNFAELRNGLKGSRYEALL